MHLGRAVMRHELPGKPLLPTVRHTLQPAKLCFCQRLQGLEGTRSTLPDGRRELLCPVKRAGEAAAGVGMGRGEHVMVVACFTQQQALQLAELSASRLHQPAAASLSSIMLSLTCLAACLMQLSGVCAISACNAEADQSVCATDAWCSLLGIRGAGATGVPTCRSACGWWPCDSALLAPSPGW